MTKSPQALTGEEQDLLLASQLSEHLRAGGDPSEQPMNIRLNPGEVGYASVQGQLLVYTGAQYVDPGSFFLAFGSPLWMLGTLGASALMNSHRRSQARAAAAHQWRLENDGIFHITNQRLALQGLHGWLDFDYRHFQAISPTALGIVAHFADWPMTLITTSHPAWTWVILSTMVFGETPVVEVSAELSAKTRRLSLEG